MSYQGQVTYKDLYDSYIREFYQGDVEKISFLRGCDAAKLMEENDPVAYRCGFADWSDSLNGILCEECGEEMDSEALYDATMEAIPTCSKCLRGDDEADEDDEDPEDAEEDDDD